MPWKLTISGPLLLEFGAVLCMLFFATQTVAQFGLVNGQMGVEVWNNQKPKFVQILDNRIAMTDQKSQTTQ